MLLNNNISQTYSCKVTKTLNENDSPKSTILSKSNPKKISKLSIKTPPRTAAITAYLFLLK
jgi:hypothetical protein